MEFNLYKNEISPLERVSVEDAIVNELYILSTGTRVRMLPDFAYEINKSSELVDGERVEDLTPKQLDLFWKLMRNRK